METHSRLEGAASCRWQEVVLLVRGVREIYVEFEICQKCPTFFIVTVDTRICSTGEMPEEVQVSKFMKSS
jgi:hypothetical protein